MVRRSEAKKTGRRTGDKLSAVAVKRAKTPGLLPDGLGLYLQVGPVGNKSWVFRYSRGGRERLIGLGAEHAVTLAEARDKAKQCRGWLVDGRDPLAERERIKRERLANDAKQLTFAECATRYIDAHSTGWKNAKHRDQWVNTLRTYADPLLGKLLVRDIDTGLIFRVLQPIWDTKAETASRVRSRIENVLSWATVSGLRTGDNPARWRGHLDQLLAPKTYADVIHHPALPYVKIGAFLADVRGIDALSARALEFTILTAARTGETIGAHWKEFDLDAKAWTIPASRMKAGKEHRVPLSPPVLALLKKLPAQGDFVFPGPTGKKPLSNMAMLTLLRRMDRTDVTVHGFRSSFRDWAAERTNYPREVCELALAHGIPDKVEAAYRRGELFEKRAKLMTEWAAFCAVPSEGKVIKAAFGKADKAAK